MRSHDRRLARRSSRAVASPPSPLARRDHRRQSRARNTTTSARTPTASRRSTAIFDAVAHLYTMCRHVKSIEIIEFGYEKSTEGINGAKSEYCVDKQKLNMTRPYQAALRRRRRVDAGGRGPARACRSLARSRWPSSRGSRAKPTTTTRRASTMPYEDFRDAHRRASSTIDRGIAEAKPRAPRSRAPRRRKTAPAREGSALTPLERRAAAATRRRRRRRRRRPSSRAIFGDGGTLARALPGFRFRPQQLAMAEAVARAIARRAASWSPRPAPAPARRSPISCPRCSPAAR